MLSSRLIRAYHNINVLDKHKVIDLLVKEKPDIVVNYAIPLTWDATKQLKNYNNISKAGL